MEVSKATIRDQLTKGRLEEAIASAIEYATYCGLSEIVNALTALMFQAQDHHQKWNTGIISYEESSLKQAQISYHLTEWINHLPDQPVARKGKRKRLMDEATFKSRIFYALCISKLLIFFYLHYLWKTGGFTVAEFQSTATLLLPAFAAYISVIIGDYLNQSRSPIKAPKFIAGPLVTFAYWLFPIYFLVLCFLITAKAKTDITYGQMNFWLAMAESVLGGYVGQLVHSLFKKG